MTRPMDQHKGRRQARPARKIAVAAVGALLALSGCGSSKPASQPKPSAILDNATLADVACNDAGWTALQDYTRTILLQAALYQGHLRQGEPGGPPAGATWLVNGLIDPAKAATSPDFRTWTADTTVQVYLKPLEDWEASTRRDYICSASSTTTTPRPTVSLFDFVCRAGLPMPDGSRGSFPETLGWTGVDNYVAAVVGQSAIFTGWMKQGSAGGPPADASWLKSGQLTPGSISINSEYAQWAANASNPSAGYFSALVEYDVVAGNHLCGATDAQIAKQLTTQPTSINLKATS
jgi:hypothetical protein